MLGLAKTQNIACTCAKCNKPVHANNINKNVFKPIANSSFKNTFKEHLN